MAKTILVKMGYQYYVFDGSQAQLLQFMTLADQLQPVSQDYISGDGYRYTVKGEGDDEIEISFELVKESQIDRPDSNDWAIIKKAKKESSEAESKFYGQQARVRQLEKALEKHGITVDDNGCTSVKTGED